MIWTFEDNRFDFSIFKEDNQKIYKKFIKFQKKYDNYQKTFYKIALIKDKKAMEKYQTYNYYKNSVDVAKEVNGNIYMFGCSYEN